MTIAVLVGVALVMFAAAALGYKLLKALVKLLLVGGALVLLALAYLAYTHL